MNNNSIRLDTMSNQGVFDRAIMVARELYKANLWDGQQMVTIVDANGIFNRMFGLDRQPVSELTAGVDYIVA